MSTQQELEGYSGNFNFGGTGRLPIRQDGYGGLNVSQQLPAGFALARAGRTFVASGGVIANGVIPVVDVPTVASKWLFHNNNALGSGIVCVIRRLSFYYASGTGGAAGACLMAAVSTASQAAPTAATGAVVKSTSGSSSYTPKGFLGVAGNLGGAGAWEVVARAEHGANTVMGPGGVSDDLSGDYILPPQFALGLIVLADTGTTAKYLPSIRFSEIDTNVQ